MPNIVFIHPDGVREELEIDEGTSVMQGATSQGIDGIVAECGGNCSCATCHVYVGEDFASIVGPPGDMEEDLIDMAVSERRDTSRLSCQIRITEALDGLTVEIPPDQP